MANNKRQYEALKFTYGASDIQELGQQLARETQTVYDLQDKKKQNDTDMAALIKGASSRVQDITRKLNNGYEMREVEVLILMDEPKQGMKRIVRVDNNEHLRDEAMTLEEMQRGFGFPESE